MSLEKFEQNSEYLLLQQAARANTPRSLLRGKRANSKQSKYVAAERPQERLLLTVEDSLQYYWQAYSPQLAAWEASISKFEV